MKSQTIFYFLIIFTIVLLNGCKDNNNPLAPDDDPGNDKKIEIKTPQFLKLSKIILSRFPSTKSNGDKWDWHTFPNSPTRRPDIYVELKKSGSDSYIYQSGVKEDAIFNTAYDSFSFTKSGLSNGTNLPHNLLMNQTYTIEVLDDDGLTQDDLMGEFNLKPIGYYNDDNATHLYKTFSSGSLTIKIEGTWIY